MPTTRRYAKGESKRIEILNAALEVFAQEGYRSTSLRQIASKAEISLGGLMHYFSSKEELLTEVLAHRDAVDTEILCREKDKAPPLERLAMAMRTNMSRPGLVELYVTLAVAASSPNHPAHDYFKQRYQDMRRIAAEWVSQAIADGTIPSQIDAGQAATSIIAEADGIQLQWLHDRSIDMEAHVRQVANRFIESSLNQT